MRFLLDTHLLIWLALEPDRLSPSAADLIASDANAIVFSVASIWEITIKRTVSRDDFDIEPAAFRSGLIAFGIEELPILGDHVLATGLLPLLHKDPFDRLLLAQATVEGLTLLTADAQLVRYPGPIRRV